MKTTEPFRTNVEGYTQETWEEEFKELYIEVLKEVYLFEITDKMTESAEKSATEGWSQTNFQPIRFVEFLISPLRPTNMIERGQKAREKRWFKWLESKGYQSKEG